MPFFPYRDDYKKTIKIVRAGKDVERSETLSFLIGMTGFCHHRKQLVLLKTFTKSFIRPQILPLGIYREGFKTEAVYVSVSSTAHRI